MNAGGRHTVRALSQEVWSSRLADVYPPASRGHRAICVRSLGLVSAASVLREPQEDAQ